MNNTHLLVEPINHAAALARLQRLATAVSENRVKIEDLAKPRQSNDPKYFDYDIVEVL